MKYIFLISRAAAFTVDYCLFFLVSIFFNKYGFCGYLLSLIIFFLYRYLTSAYFGATLGMMLLKLKLNKYDFKICLKREIYRFASALFYLGYIYAIFDVSGRTLHDIAADTNVIYLGNKDEPKSTPSYYYKIALVLLIISSIRWLSYVVLNDIGLIGLKRIYESDEYFQSFEGDKLMSLSQDELYMKTLGRKYTALIDFKDKPSIIRISNKLKYTEVYKLNLIKPRIVGEYIYKVDMPLQFICSGNFKGKRDLCGLSPQNDIVLVNEYGNIYGRGKSGIASVRTLRCGDIDEDGIDETMILGTGGEIEVYKFNKGILSKVYGGRTLEDVIPETFYIDNGAAIISRYDEKKILYFYDYKEDKFIYRDKKYFNTNGVSAVSKSDNFIITSHVFRNPMIFKRGGIQRFEAYRIDASIKRIYNFGSRPGRGYAYMVRTLEDTFDIDGDGEEEIILKAVGKNDVMGQGYIVEVYKFNRRFLFINRILSWIEDVLYY